MKRFLVYILLLLPCTLLHAQTVTNVDARQDGQNIVITFNMDKPSTPAIMYSTNGKNGPYNIIPEQFLQKTSVQGKIYEYKWNVLEQFEEFSFDNVVFKIVSQDIYDYPSVIFNSSGHIIKRITLSSEFTIVEVKLYTSLLWMNIDKNTYIETGGKKYTMIDAKNIEIAPQKINSPREGDVFKLFFPPINLVDSTFNLVEPGSDWGWYGISIKKVIPIKEGKLNDVFSISDNRRVRFSQGNLQYQASTNTWRFAEKQYDVIGNYNKNISSTYGGWIDLFGWGTSGYKEKPYLTSTTPTDYGNGVKNITGTYYEWGVYNKISNGGSQTIPWRTLTYNEWDYLINSRKDANIKYGVACINGVNGLILLPDNWKLPNGLSFDRYSQNTYSIAQWAKMEANGAVFLPATGGRVGTDVYFVNSNGYYWSSSASNNEGAYLLMFVNGGMGMSNFYRHEGHSVRLVQDVK